MSKHLVVIAALVVSAPAIAQIDEDVGRTMREHRANEVEFFGGGGIGDLTGDLGDISDAGVAWSGRIGYMPWDFVGVEASYTGLNGNVDTLIAPPALVLDNQDIVQHQITGHLKGGWPIMTTGERELLPYGLIGAGWSRLQVEDELSLVGFADDNLFALPVGGGITYDITKNVAVDGRFVYNFLSGVDNFDLIGNDANSWMATLNIGARLDLGGR